MSTLIEIEKAADTLPVEEKRKLAVFLLTRLRVETPANLPPVRNIPKEQIEKWITDDEAGYHEFKSGV